jgi:hypothetical protein
LNRLPPNIELQLESVRTRIELLRLAWLQTCEKECFPPIEKDLEILQREFQDLEAMVREVVR